MFFTGAVVCVGRQAHVQGAIVHLLSCQAGALLGLAIVHAGARAFWGYTVNFTFWHDDPAPDPLDTDETADLFFGLDAIIDRGILTGKPAAIIYQDVIDAFWDAHEQLLPASSSQDVYPYQLVAATLLDDFVHLVCPVTTWGDQQATLSVGV